MRLAEACQKLARQRQVFERRKAVPAALKKWLAGGRYARSESWDCDRDLADWLRMRMKQIWIIRRLHVTRVAPHLLAR